jgi:hypothetical protein
MVIEAFNLLRQSIISVEKDDVDVDEDDEELVSTLNAANFTGNGSRDHEGDSPMGGGDDHHDGMDGAESQTPAPGQGRKTKITYDKYMKVMNILVRHINEEELTTGEGVEGNDLVQRYLEQIEEELQSVEQHDAEAVLVKKVIKRLIKVCFYGSLSGLDRKLIYEIGEYTDGCAWRRTAGRRWRRQFGGCGTGSVCLTSKLCSGGCWRRPMKLLYCTRYTRHQDGVAVFSRRSDRDCSWTSLYDYTAWR